jgi:uncharacterized protein
MKKAIACLCFVVTFAAANFAQRSAVANTAPSKQDVLRFLDLMQVRARMLQMVDGMREQGKRGAEAALRARIPNPTPDQLEKATKIGDVIFQDFPIDEMVDAVVPIYQRHLTKTDLDAVVAFYSGSTGQKLLKESPAMMSEGMKAGGDIMLKKIPDLTQRVETQIAEMVKEEQQKSGTKRRPTVEN